MSDRKRPATTPAGSSRPGAGRGAEGRVAAVHAQTRQGLLLAAAFTAAAIVAGVIAGVTDAPSGWWLPLHLFVVGGLLSAISAASQMLAVTWSASPAPDRRLAGAQRWGLAAGALAMVAGREAEATWLFACGGVAVVLAMLVLVPILLRVRGQAVTDRFAPAIETYAGAILAGAVGMSLGIVLGTGRAGNRLLELRGAHLLLNVYGLVGLVVAGTLPFFTATQVRAKMSPRATPATMRLTFAALGVAVAIAVAGRLLDRSGVVAVGLVAYALGLGVVAALLPVYGPGRLRWAGPRALQMLAGLAWWAAMTVALAAAALGDREDRQILQALVIGGFAQILVASLAYLGPVLRGGGHAHLTAGFAVTRSWVSLVAANAAAVGALAGARPVVVVALVVWLLDLASRAVRLVAARRPARTGS